MTRAQRRPWAAAEIARLVEAYPTTPTRALAAEFGCDEQRVYQKAYSLGLSKTTEYLEGPQSGRLNGRDTRGADKRFSAGHVPWNKGKSFDAGGRSHATRFKKGSRPQTWVPVGTYRITADGYLERKVADTGRIRHDWVGVHRLVWMDAHGAIPPGHIVVFRPGRRTTDLDLITVDALECITRVELMRRNSVHRYPAEIGRLVQLRGALTRQINKRNLANENSR